jgi:hypothetical protein
MMWRHYGAFPFRDDDSATLQRIMDEMHRDGHWITEPDTPAYALKVEDVSALAYLRMAVDSIHDEEDAEFSDVLLIAAHHRPTCERLLRDNCPSPVQWFSVVVVGASTGEALERFTALYDEHVDINRA